MNNSVDLCQQCKMVYINDIDLYMNEDIKDMIIEYKIHRTNFLFIW